jgi:hypothetical protein
MLISQAAGLAGLLVLVAIRAKGPPELVKLLPAAIAGVALIAAG